MADSVKSSGNVHTSTPFPDRKFANTKKLFNMTPTQEPLSPVLKKSTMMQLVIKAIQAVGLPKKGASLQAIKKWITANSDHKPRSQNAILKKAILKGIELGTIIKPPHSKNVPGISGSFVLASTLGKVKVSPKNKAETKKTVKSPKTNKKMLKAPKEMGKELKSSQNTKVAKKGSRKNVKTPLKKIPGKKSNKHLSSSPKAKKEAKIGASSKAISKKGTGNGTISVVKRTVKNRLKNKPPSPEVDDNAYIFTDSDGENPEMQAELGKDKKANTYKVLNKEKSTKTKEQPDIKSGASKTAIAKSEKDVQPKKMKEDSNIKLTEQSSSNRETLKETVGNQVKTKMMKTKLNEREIATDDFDVTRMSDTELDTRPNLPKPIKYYASDTELEISKRMVPRSKKIKPERKTLTKKIRKNAAETIVAGTESDSDNTKSIKPQNQARHRKTKQN